MKKQTLRPTSVPKPTIVEKPRLPAAGPAPVAPGVLPIPRTKKAERKKPDKPGKSD